MHTVTAIPEAEGGESLETSLRPVWATQQDLVSENQPASQPMYGLYIECCLVPTPALDHFTVIFFGHKIPREEE